MNVVASGVDIEVPPTGSAAWTKLLDRLMGHVEVTSSGCWEWTGRRDEGGYGRMRVGRMVRRAHRVAWRLLRGPFPDGLVPDHSCRNRACVRPDHLEWVTRRENSIRGEHPNVVLMRAGRCAKGHEIGPGNIFVDYLGRSRCRICQRASWRRKKQRERVIVAGRVAVDGEDLRRR